MWVTTSQDCLEAPINLLINASRVKALVLLSSAGQRSGCGVLTPTARLDQVQKWFTGYSLLPPKLGMKPLGGIGASVPAVLHL